MNKYRFKKEISRNRFTNKVVGGAEQTYQSSIKYEYDRKLEDKVGQTYGEG